MAYVSGIYDLDIALLERTKVEPKLELIEAKTVQNSTW